MLCDMSNELPSKEHNRAGYKRKKIALIHRYGLGGWLCCGGHAVPRLIEILSAEAEIHFFGPQSTEPVAPDLEKLFVSHILPWRFNRANPRDKWTKTLRFYLALPGIGRQCRKLGVDFIYWEETLPWGALLLQLFYGRTFAIMVMDFFVRIYTEKKPWLHWLRDLIEKIDCRSWRKLPLLFVHVQAAKAFLSEHGIDKDQVRVVANPCNHEVFHPVNAETRADVRQSFGYTEKDVVLTHHGILHPNKGNDWILHSLSRVVADLPNIKLLLIGDGPERSRLEAMAKKLDVADRVTFTGWLPSENDLNRVLASMDIGLVMRTGQETDHFHMTDTLNHEMACAKPILAVNLRGIAEFVKDAENGYLFSVDDPHIFCQRLHELQADAELRDRLGAAALDTSRRVSGLEACAQHMAAAILAATSAK